MYSIDWLLFIAQNIFIAWIEPITMEWLSVVVYPLKKLHADFLAYRAASLYTLNFNGQIIYLQHVLNDRFDSTLRRIYINNVADVNRVYLFNKAELRPPFYMYNKHDVLVPYTIGQFAVQDNKVWIATAPSTGEVPFDGSLFWDFFKDIVFFRNASEYGGAYDFIVMVPIDLVFDINEMKALINFYKAAGKRYTIQTF